MRALHRIAESPPAPADEMLATLCARVSALEAQVEALAVKKTVAGPTDPVAAKADDLRAACADVAISVSGDGYIRESDAARLLNRATSTLRNWRYAARPLPFRMFGGRIEYRLADLAAFLAEHDDS